MYPFGLVVEVMDGSCSISNSGSSSGTYSGRRSSTTCNRISWFGNSCSSSGTIIVVAH